VLVDVCDQFVVNRFMNRFSEPVNSRVVKPFAADRSMAERACRAAGPASTLCAVSPTKRVTIRQVADAAGLSPAAVSYALRGIQVSEETQERVRKVATELGYEANPIARALASGRSGMVGILGPTLEDLWQQRLVAEADRVLLEHERYALILDPGADPERQRILAGRLRDQHVDGLIVSPIDPADEFWVELAASLPVVSIGDSLTGAAAVGEVLFDNRTGVRSALEHLHALGHRRVAVLSPPGSPTTDRPAELFVVAEADRLDLDVRVLTAAYELGPATDLAHELLDDAHRPTATFCFSDSIAYGVYAAARELAIPIPDELSVIGYDDHPISALLSPSLTSFSWGSKRLVETAIGLLLGAIDGRPSAHRRVIITPELRDRCSTARPPT
jgi:LacI family transcriptional regulator